jgi:hypothetical protein
MSLLLPGFFVSLLGPGLLEDRPEVPDSED